MRYLWVGFARRAVEKGWGEAGLGIRWVWSLVDFSTRVGGERETFRYRRMSYAKASALACLVGMLWCLEICIA